MVAGNQKKKKKFPSFVSVTDDQNLISFINNIY